MDGDARWMRAALNLARRGLGEVWPNPAVGCVITREGRVVGRGRTAAGGRPHAEAAALAAAGDAAAGATAFVTLEPCAHHGATPPCADGLIAAGIARVVVALGDPDPRVSGRGLTRLREAGVEVETGVLEAEAAHLQRGFLSRTSLGRPMLTLKLATSLDGRIATASGESRWISGSEARRRVHGMRLSHDAVLVGGGTARADDPSMTARGFGRVRQPVRVVASASLDVPRQGALWRTARDSPVWLCHAPEAGEERRAAWLGAGAELIEIPTAADGYLDPESLLATLGARGLTRVLCEGGGTLAASLLRAGVVDRLAHFGAGLALGAEGLPGVGSLSVAALGDAERFELESVDVVGPDTMTVWRGGGAFHGGAGRLAVS